MKRGFTLLETVVYTAVFALMLLTIVGAIFAMVRASRDLTEERRVALSAHVALDRLTRDVREGEAFGASVFDVHPGVLTVTAGATTTEFYVEDDALKVKENGVSQGSLTAEGVTVSSFIVRQFSSGDSTGIRAELELRAGTSTSLYAKRFYTSAVLRNGY